MDAPINDLCMPERDYHFVDHSICADCSADELHLCTRWIVWNEVISIETTEIFRSNATCKSGDVVNITANLFSLNLLLGSYTALTAQGSW